jgi:arylsulfatase A
MTCKSKLPLLAIGVASAISNGCNRDNDLIPNVVFIIADDLGWSQSGAYGSEYYHTPNIDRLSAEGIRFTDAYSAAAMSSPTRASIMTGKYPSRLHLTDFIPGNQNDHYPLSEPDWQKYLPLEEFTIGNLFSEMGYRTAMFGKWHLSKDKFGPESISHNPDRQGFDRYFIIDKPDSTFDPGHDPHSSDSIGNTSVRFIRENADNPFFLVMSFSAIHDPLMESADAIAKWKSKPASEEPENNPVIAVMLERLDRNIGKVLDELDKLDLAKNTLVIFYSDNGGRHERIVVHNEERGRAWQTPLRKGKGWLYEGGIRVPLIIKWPGAIDNGRVSNEMVSSNDFMPTFCELLGRKPEPDVDGISLLQHLKSGKALNERNLYWHYPHYHSGSGMVPAAAIRSGNWKLIEWYEKSILESDEPAYELYDLQNDIGETVNLAGQNKELTMELAKELEKWRKEVNAQMPVPNQSISSFKSIAGATLE